MWMYTAIICIYNTCFNQSFHPPIEVPTDIAASSDVTNAKGSVFPANLPVRS